MLEAKFFVAGDDHFSVAKRGSSIVQAFGDAEVEIIDSDAGTIAEVTRELREVCEALRTIPFGAVKKFVWYRGVSFLGDTQLSHAEDVLGWLQELQNLFGKLPDVGCLVTAEAIDKRQKTVKWFLENCHTEILDAPKRGGCEQYIRDGVRHAQKKITAEALNKFLLRTGNDLAMIDTELDKLLLYVGGKGDIEPEDIDAIVIDWRDSDFFEAIDLFFGDDVAAFLDGIHRQFLYRGEGRPLLAALQNRVRLLIQLRYFYENDALERISKAELERLKMRYEGICYTGTGSIFNQNPWYLGKLLSIAQKSSLHHWIAFQVKLLQSLMELAENVDRQSMVFEKLYFQLKGIKGSSPILLPP
jgi:DNA polymerase-3 subunit delta